MDSAGDLFVADSTNDRIRKVNAAGTISTVAGTGKGSYSGDGGPATSAELNAPERVSLDTAGNLYIGDSKNNRVRQIEALGAPAAGVPGAPTGASATGGNAQATVSWTTPASDGGSGRPFPDAALKP